MSWYLHALVVGGVAAVLTSAGCGSHDGSGGAPNHTPRSPASTITTTVPGPTKTKYRTHTSHAPSAAPTYAYPSEGADGVFLAKLELDGISAPDDWAIQAGHDTCHMDYDSATAYLEDGGIYPEHVDTFLEDYGETHQDQGCEPLNG